MQIKTCRKKRHVQIDDMKKAPNEICGKIAVGGNYNSTRDTIGYDCFLKKYMLRQTINENV